MIYLLLFWEYLKIGLFSIGGGLAALPFLFDLSDRYAWFSHSELADMVAVAEATPGPIAINMATYTGYHMAGVAGSLIATLGIVLPSLLISLLICRLLSRYAESPWPERVFHGLRPAVAGLITAIGLQLTDLALAVDMARGLPAGAEPKALILFILLLPAVFRLKLHPIAFIAAGAAAGMIFGF